MPTVTVIDYGMGNLLSVCRALEHLGADVILSQAGDTIADAQRLILPGVGAFGDGMAELGKRRLIAPLRRAADAGTPLLGICLGAQMLLDGSEEFGEHPGLGLIPGAVRAIPDHGRDGQPLKVPHMGWAELLPTAQGLAHPLLAGIRAGSSVYFVHSYQAHTQDPADVVARCDHGGNTLTAMIAHANIYGCQFHPEKSGPVGLRLLKNFLELSV